VALVEATVIHEQIPWPLWTAFAAAIVAAWYCLMRIVLR
jgi:hypothetical protein